MRLSANVPGCGSTYDIAGITSGREAFYATASKLCRYFGLDRTPNRLKDAATNSFNISPSSRPAFPYLLIA